MPSKKGQVASNAQDTEASSSPRAISRDHSRVSSRTDSRASPALSNSQIAAEFSGSSEDDSSGFQEISSISNSSTSSLDISLISMMSDEAQRMGNSRKTASCPHSSTPISKRSRRTREDKDKVKEFSK